jgi:hypothetical protein
MFLHTQGFFYAMRIIILPIGPERPRVAEALAEAHVEGLSIAYWFCPLTQ